MRLRRLLTTMALLAAVPASLLGLASQFHPAGAAPAPADYSPTPLPKLPRAGQLRDASLQLAATAASESVAGRTRLVPASAPGHLPSLVLGSRTAPYTIAELRRRVPQAFSSLPQGVLVLANVVVPVGASLEVTGQDTPSLFLESSAGGFATLVAQGGYVRIAGTPSAAVHVSSWDPSRSAPDATVEDGRAFVLAQGTTMDLDHAVLEDLGFGTGLSSGVAWKGTGVPGTAGAVPARGTVAHTVFAHNWFGAYTYQAEAMSWTANTFQDNAAYGFDPHDYSDHFTVEGNTARRNGRHGFIFSYGCDDNVMRGNRSYDNRGHGFMIDDGRSKAAANAPARVDGSDRNRIVDNAAHDNDGAGVVVEGGTGNVVEGNVLARNHVGARLKDGASALVTRNRIIGNTLYGVDVLPTAQHVTIARNVVSGGWGGVRSGRPHVSTLAGNTLRAGSVQLVAVEESTTPAGVLTRVQRIVYWNPLLSVWALILGVPLLARARGAVRGHGRSVRGRRSVRARTVPNS